MNDLRDTCERDRAADRAASAARTLAAIANDAARKYIKRDAVAPQADGRYALVMPNLGPIRFATREVDDLGRVDIAEAERQARLRRWQTPPHSNRKGG